jgi:hypothetical protein
MAARAQAAVVIAAGLGTGAVEVNADGAGSEADPPDHFHEERLIRRRRAKHERPHGVTDEYLRAMRVD